LKGVDLQVGFKFGSVQLDKI